MTPFLIPLMSLALLQGPREPMLVTPAWLAEHARDANLVLLHAGPRASYDSAHIAGARFIEMADVAAPDDTTRPDLELPTAAALDSALEARGISDDSRIVIYQSDDWLSPSTRVYLTLYWAGLGARTSILDGGLAAWRRHGGAVTAAEPRVARGHLTLHPRDDVVVTASWIAARLGDPHVHVVDARNANFFLGNNRPRPGAPRAGHIPGAYLIPFETVVDSNAVMREVPWLRALFESVRARSQDTVVTYCHIGQQATVVWFAARLAGYDARLYDGSFGEWSKLSQYPVERP